MELRLVEEQNFYFFERASCNKSRSFAWLFLVLSTAPLVRLPSPKGRKQNFEVVTSVFTVPYVNLSLFLRDGSAVSTQDIADPARQPSPNKRAIEALQAKLASLKSQILLASTETLAINVKSP